jgi:2OG-Fe(II) oxygenase superfamily
MAQKKLTPQAQLQSRRLLSSRRHEREVAEVELPPQESLSEVLGALNRPGSFAVRREVPTSDFLLEVSGVGPISLPVSPAKARALCSVAKPARHGFKDQTRLDKAVRDTWEIPRTRLKLDQRRWKQTLAPELLRIKTELGLAGDCELRAELHNLLVYAPGQFFVPHQDTEKADGMLGTLVVTLPSAFTGGAIVVKHHDEKVEFRGASRKLVMMAFYADCHHEVRPVKTGYRVVLTYNLLLSKSGSRLHPPASPAELDTLQARVREFFQRTNPPRWPGAAPEGPPDRLVYLLDHQYTQRGLGWHQLKNADAVRVAALREVAERLDCDMALALADVHETWSCQDEGYGYGRYGRYGRRSHGRSRSYEDDSTTSEGDLPELTQLEHSEVELRHFVDATGKAVTASGRAATSELCFTKPSVDLDPFESTHEGYMGNWGNTVDHWYHRAAFVLWPRERTFLIRAKASANYALDELSKTLARDDVKAARHQVEQLAPFWTTVWREPHDPRLVDKALRVALALDAPELAHQLLLPLDARRLTPSTAPAVVSLLERYGFDWMKKVLAGWEPHSGTRLDPTWLKWRVSFPSLIHAVLKAGSAQAPALARQLVSDQWKRMAAQQRAALQDQPSAVLADLRHLEEPLLGLLEGAVLAGSTDVHDDIRRFLRSDYPLSALAHFIEVARRRDPSALNLRDVEAHCVSELRKRLAKPVRPVANWSIETPSQCKCQLCAELSRFLVAAGRVTHEWPLATNERQHIHQVIDRYELPVTHTTRRSGRPYTLVLTKTQDLFRREAAQRTAWQKALDSLTLPEPARSRRSSAATTKKKGRTTRTGRS